MNREKKSTVETCYLVGIDDSQKSIIYNLQVIDKIEYSQTCKIDFKTNEHQFYNITQDATKKPM